MEGSQAPDLGVGWRLGEVRFHWSVSVRRCGFRQAADGRLVCRCPGEVRPHWQRAPGGPRVRPFRMRDRSFVAEATFFFPRSTLFLTTVAGMCKKKAKLTTASASRLPLCRFGLPKQVPLERTEKTRPRFLNFLHGSALVVFSASSGGDAPGF